MIEFQALKETDIETVVVMMQEFYAIDHYPFNSEVAKKLFHTFISDKNLGNCWIIKCNGAFVGYVILTYIFSFEYQGKIAFLDELYVNENARGKGIGQEAIAFVQNQALLKDLKLIYLEIESHNIVAKKLYLSRDFIIHNRQIMKYIPKP
ncbi:GNAT family N-acetyltransferase [Flavobacterium sp.]|jgi:ribosomal protein S18 acetylase RimI-like enzyme|uniref:GNAT family N-acetyltransferase n=1 Tax=Flavobacterium sp. TaxID=239 RepID=UPI0037BF9521